MAKIVLIDPYGWQGAVSGYGPAPNIGIAYLIPLLHQHGHEVLVLDLNNEALTDEEVLAGIEGYQADIVGISVKTATMKSARRLAQRVKSRLPKIPVILGGPHTRIACRDLLAEPCYDIILVGEGELVLPVLCDRLMADELIEDLPGVVTRNNLKDGGQFSQALLAAADLDILPFPEYDLFPKNVREALQTAYPLVTSRGCVYQCIYCSVPKISGRKFRKRSSENIIAELRWARKKHGAIAFEIIDDVFNFDLTRCKEICRGLIKADLQMTWSCPNGLRADRIDRELAELMFKSGCHSVMVGIESGDPSILEGIKKGESIEDIERGIRIFQAAGMNVGGYFILGLPGDSFKAEERSVEFAKRMGISAFFNMLVPYPGTELWEWAKTKARLLNDIENGRHFADSSNKVVPVVETDDFPAPERRRAYEMVHTRLGRFDMLIPGDIKRMKYHSKVLWLLWDYDRSQVLNYIFKRLIGKFSRMLPNSPGVSRTMRRRSYSGN